jgi:hypothetical protein
MRQHFLSGFSSQCNAEVLLTAGILHLCATKHGAQLQHVLEKARVLSPRQLTCHDAWAAVGLRMIDRLGRPPSVEQASSLRETFDNLSSFLDKIGDPNGIILRGSSRVLAEVQNIQPLPDAQKFSQHRVPRTPSTVTPEWDSFSECSMSSFNQRASMICEPEDACQKGVEIQEHPLEVILCVIQSLERHTCLGIVVVRALAQLAMHLACEAADRADLLAAPVWTAGRVEQSAAQDVACLSKDAPGRDDQIRMLSSDGKYTLERPIVDLCGSVASLMELSTSCPAQAGKERAASALESLSVIRRLHSDLIECTQDAPPQEDKAINSLARMVMPQNRFGTHFGHGVKMEGVARVMASI